MSSEKNSWSWLSSVPAHLFSSFYTSSFFHWCFVAHNPKKLGSFESNMLALLQLVVLLPVTQSAKAAEGPSSFSTTAPTPTPCDCENPQCIQLVVIQECLCLSANFQCDIDACSGGDHRHSHLLSEVISQEEKERCLPCCWRDDTRKNQNTTSLSSRDFDYDGAVYVDNHLYAVTTPKEEAAVAGCPLLVAHSFIST